MLDNLLRVICRSLPLKYETIFGKQDPQISHTLSHTSMEQRSQSLSLWIVLVILKFLYVDSHKNEERGTVYIKNPSIKPFLNVYWQ